MKPRKRAVRVGTFENLEDRVVLNAAQNRLIVADVTSFYSNYVSTIPSLVAAVTGAADSTAKATAQTALTNAITTDVNNLGTQLQKDLGASSTSAINLSITGGTASLMNALLQVASADPAFLAETGGINLATNLSIGAATALTQGRPSFPTSSFGTASSQFFQAIQTPAAQLEADQDAASTPPTTDQQAAINASIATIDAGTIANTNALATNLLTTLGKGSTAAIQQVITGVPSTQAGVTFTSSGAGSTAAFGSLLAALQSIESDPALLTNVNVVAGIYSLYAFI
jgi:hypothetical protein